MTTPPALLIASATTWLPAMSSLAVTRTPAMGELSLWLVNV